MVLFVAYAVLVWYFAVKWRRRPWAFVAVAVGLCGLAVVAFGHWRLSIWSGGRIYLPVLQSLLYPYAALVAVIGVYIGCLPRARPAHECRACRYDLRGLQAHAAAVCPECGSMSGQRRFARSPQPGPLPNRPREWFRPIHRGGQPRVMRQAIPVARVSAGNPAITSHLNVASVPAVSGRITGTARAVAEAPIRPSCLANQ